MFILPFCALDPKRFQCWLGDNGGIILSAECSQKDTGRWEWGQIPEEKERIRGNGEHIIQQNWDIGLDLFMKMLQLLVTLIPWYKNAFDVTSFPFCSSFKVFKTWKWLRQIYFVFMFRASFKHINFFLTFEPLIFLLEPYFVQALFPRLIFQNIAI